VLILPPEHSAADVWTVGRIIDWTTQHLKKHGSETPRLEAEILLAKARGCPRIQLYVDYAVPLTDPQRATMRDLVRRRAQAEPVAYLVGHREFFGLDFQVTHDVLIPRPETETLVLEVITAIRRQSEPSDTTEPESSAEASDPAAASADVPAAVSVSPLDSTGSAETSEKRPLRVIDLGTGSGCIAVSCAVNLADVELTAVDISPAALAVARENAAAHKVQERIRFLEGDLFAPVPAGEMFDVIVSNPPYVADADMETLSVDIRQHEPHLALRAGPHGLDVITRLIAEAVPRLVPGGLLLIEFSPEQTDAVVALAATHAELEPAQVLKDSAGQLRAVRIRRKNSE
jgi:release factor glutamine methyltransferase